MAKDSDVQFSDFTAGEKVRMAGLVALMAKRGLADDGTGRVLDDVKKRMARIEKQAARRKNSK
ncbi:hypothetical protein QFZ75_003668 [Streptomyces sp. V3I8]|uniref:DUF6257 family protein n=1 Tax=Streptomyces sp. V3I8 TaxID=3042279 RepID=UPI00277DA00E|nr:DUF6257 family protein [Streptomyces sp. V3I8]MDQ1037252.1 hypothetical protein [Streptomyces sp. V3I8]